MRDSFTRASHGGALTLGMAALLAVACGGTTSIGNRRGAELGDAGPSSTGGAPGTAGGSNGGDPGKGGNPSQGGSGQAGDPGKGGNPSQGGSGQGGSPTGVKCQAASDCITPSLCRACPDGSQICDKADCVNGQCVTYFIDQTCGGTCDPAQCPSQTNGKGCCAADASCGIDYGDARGCVVPGQCTVDTECNNGVPPPPCSPCPDGSCAPWWRKCIGGKCQSGIDQCPGAPLWYQLCGDPVCQVPSPPTGVAPCDPTQGEKSGGPCAKIGSQCDPGLGCGILLGCQTAPVAVCPL